MLKSLFKPRWQHQDEQVRESAILALDEQQDEEAIIQVASTDPVIALRQLAISRLSQFRGLQALLQKNASPEYWLLVASRIITLFPDKSDYLIEQFNQKVLPDSKDQPWGKGNAILVLLKQSDSLLIAPFLLSSDDTAVLSEVVIKAKPLDLKLKALDKISTLPVLQSLLKQVTHKQVIQSIRSKIKQEKSIEEAISSQRKQADKIATALQKLSVQHWDSQFEVKVQSLLKQWNAIEENHRQHRAVDFQQARAASQVILDSRQQEIQQLKQAEEASQIQIELSTQLSALRDEIYSQSLDSSDSVSDAYHLIDKNWRQMSGDYSPAKNICDIYFKAKEELFNALSFWQIFSDMRESFSQLIQKLAIGGRVTLADLKQTEIQEEESKIDETVDCEKLSKGLTQWRRLYRQLNWPEKQSCPSEMLSWQKTVTKLEDKVVRYEAEQKKKSAKINQKLRIMEKHLANKNLIAANKLTNHIQFQTEKLQGRFKKSIEGKLEKLQPELDELRDWHAFATTPKKEMLCEQMEALIKVSMEPLALAEQVGKIQEQWHELIASDSNADQAFWDRFKAASDQAYLPCLEYYAGQDKIKADNLKQCLNLCDEVKLFIASCDWDNVDWKACDKKVNQLFSEWKQYTPIPANEKKSILNRFNRLIEPLKNRINEQKKLNLDARVELVSKAAKLNVIEDVESAVSQAKKLQQQWSQCGLTFVKSDREQWSLFRAEIDNVFARRKENKQEHLNQLQLNYSQMVQVVEKIQQLTQLDDELLQPSYTDYKTLREQWSDELELPKNKTRALSGEFRKVCDSYEKNYAGLESRRQKRVLEATYQLVNQVEKIEEDFLSGKSIDLSDITKKCEEGTFYAESGQILLQRLSALKNPEGLPMSDVNRQALENLVLKAEIMLGLESPEKWKSQRMKMQLEKLQQGLVSQQEEKNLREAALKFYQNWIAIGLINAEERKELGIRLKSVLKKAGL